MDIKLKTNSKTDKKAPIIEDLNRLLEVGRLLLSLLSPEEIEELQEILSKHRLGNTGDS